MKFEIHLKTFFSPIGNQHCFKQSKPDRTSSSTKTSVLNKITNEEINGRLGTSPEPTGTSFRIKRPSVRAHETNEGDVPK